MLEISLLGPLEVRVDGESTRVPGDTARRILAGLATEKTVSAHRLIDIGWGSHPPRSPKAALQTQISRLRARLGRDSIIATPSGYTFSAVTIDVDRFRALVGADRIDDLQEAMELVRGDPLVDMLDCEELTGTRRALGELIQSTQLELAERLIKSGRAAEALPGLEYLTGSAPLLEPAWLALARAAHAAGRQPDAIAALDRYRAVVAEAGLEPSPAMEAVEEGVFASPPATPRFRTRTSVPVHRSSFVGRGTELQTLVEMIASNRLVTVTGPGGMGKTRLAAEAAHRIGSSLSGGTVAVELGTDTSAPDVSSAIARAFAVRAGDDPIEAVASAVGSDPVLLLIDNCEHLIEAVRAAIGSLLSQTAHLSVLATSRQPIGLDGEALLNLSPLDPSGAAIQLFLDRATASGASIETEDRAAIERLCRRLDGMPLAIEMAAARARSVTPAELLELLRGSHAVLESRTGPPRHTTLDALVEWSYSRLEADEQLMFRALGVFAGGFTAGDAARVLGMDPHDAVRLLAHLVDRSLCQTSRRHETIEFHLLETLRVAARALLTADGEAADLHAAHGEWAASVVMEAPVMHHSPDEARSLDRLIRAIPDMMAAHERASARGDVDLQVRLVGPLFPFVYLVMPPGIAELAERTIEAAGDSPHHLLPWVDAIAAAYELAAGRSDAAESHLERARSRPHSRNAWPVWFMSTDTDVYRGRLEDARRNNRELMRLSAESAGALRPSGWTDGLISEALIAAYSGRHADAAAAAADALRRARQHGATTYIAFAEYAMGEVHQDSNPDLALNHLMRAAELSGATGTPFVEGIARTTIASVLARTGRHREALASFRDLIELLERSGARLHLWTAIRNLIVLLGDLRAWEATAVLLGATADRVRPTYGEEARRLEHTTEQARGAVGDFDSLLRIGRSTSVAEVGTLARRAIDVATGVSSVQWISMTSRSERA